MMPGICVAACSVSASRPASYSARYARGSIAIGVWRRIRNLAADPDRRRRERRVDVAALELARHHHIGSGFVVQQRAGARGLDRIGDDGQRLEIDRDQLGGVLGEIAAFRHDPDDRLADVTHLVARERQDRRRAIALHARGREQRRDLAQILRGQHRDDAGRGARRRAVDRTDARMRVLAAAERDMQHARDLPVVSIAAEPGEQARVLGAPDARADDFWPRDVGRVSHRSRRPCAACPIGRRRGRTARWRRAPRSRGSRRATSAQRRRRENCAARCPGRA